ncbi:hypothetical protein H7H82_05425 [Mycobacterium heidelbergense]|uniref:Uncharacterized protein n=1 Tax=Mycobacterium heidelbergense TaxID=53376 RepID=A0A1X0DW27_MYCHE|nr:hypothetical protein [Mycobacterium heidelbergense]MCV7050044.1 hypothetical protein [Mycobacterium heidelbergense]ORA76557.1 hypothetical protein BST25_00265 [Mycobacterium heidelbergense]
MRIGSAGEAARTAEPGVHVEINGATRRVVGAAAFAGFMPSPWGEILHFNTILQSAEDRKWAFLRY